MTITKQIPYNKKKSPTLFTRTAFIAEILACFLVYQKFISKYEQIPTNSQPIKNWTKSDEVTKINIQKVKNDK